MRFGKLTQGLSGRRVALYPDDTAGGGGGAIIYTATLDFGTVGVKTKTFTYTHTGATVGQKVLISVSGDMPAGVALDELEMDPIDVVATVISADTIKILTSSLGKIRKERNFNYIIV